MAESYIPKVLNGSATSMNVVALDPPDFRRAPVYRIVFDVIRDDNGLQDDGLVHRAYEEFVHLNTLLVALSPEVVVGSLPSKEEANVESLDAYLQTISADPDLMASTVVTDFLSINWDGKELKFMNSFEDFMYMLTGARMPDFMPEPPVIEMDTYLAEETPFEVYLYFKAFRHEMENTPEYLEYFGYYCDTTPEWSGPEDDNDVWHPSMTTEVEIPYHYNFTYVHFLPGGYLNGQTVRISYLGKTKFSFLDEEKIRHWLEELHGDKSPKKVLDMGTGGCFSAFVMGEMWPEAQVIGVDLAPPYIRFCREWQKDREVPSDNVEFYQVIRSTSYLRTYKYN